MKKKIKTDEFYLVMNEILSIKKNMTELVEVIEDLNRLLISQNTFFKHKEDTRRKYLEKELNKKWWQF